MTFLKNSLSSPAEAVCIHEIVSDLSTAMAKVRIAARSELEDIAVRIAENEHLQPEDRERIVEIANKATGTERGENDANS